MKFSIITATYNSASTLRDTLDSILAQTWQDIECIIVDGASKDGTLDIIRQYEPRFDGRLRCVSEPDRGIYDAMNKGIHMASGDIIGVLNSDDFYYDSHVVEDIAAAFERQSIDCVYGNLEFVQADSPDKVVRIWKGSQYEKGAFLKGWHPAHPTFYARRECFEKYGSFNTDYAVSADFELMLRFIEKWHIPNAYLDRYFVKMRWGGESTGTLRNIVRGNRNIIRAFHSNGLKPARFFLVRRLAPKVLNMLKQKMK